MATRLGGIGHCAEASRSQAVAGTGVPPPVTHTRSRMRESCTSGSGAATLVLQPGLSVVLVSGEVPRMTSAQEALGWARGLDEVAERIAPRFGRAEPRRRAYAYL